MFITRNRPISLLRPRAPLDRSSGALSRAKSLQLFNSGANYTNVVDGSIVTPALPVGNVSLNGYVGPSITGSGNYIRNDAWATALTKDAGTIAILWAPLTVSQIDRYAIGMRAGTGGDRYYLRNNNGALQFGWAGSAANSTTGTWILNRPDVAILTWTAANAAFCYFRGNLVGTSTSTATANPDNAVIGSAGSGGIGAFVGDGVPIALVTLPYGIGAAQARALTELMMACNQPDPVIWVADTGGGADTTAPILSSPTGTQTGSTTGTGGATTDEGNGTFYSVASTSPTAPTAAQIKAGQMHTGSAAAANANTSVSSTGAKSVNFTGLSPSSAYYAHSMHEDAAANQSNVVTSSSFTTTAGGGGSSAVSKITQLLRA